MFSAGAHWYRRLGCTIKIVTKSYLLSIVVASTQISQLSLISSNNFGFTAAKFSVLVMSLALTSLRCHSYTSPMGALSCQNGSNISFRHISPCTGLTYDARINAADQYSVNHSIWLCCWMVAAKFGLCTMSNTCSFRHPSLLQKFFSLLSL